MLGIRRLAVRVVGSQVFHRSRVLSTSHFLFCVFFLFCVLCCSFLHCFEGVFLFHCIVVVLSYMLPRVLLFLSPARTISNGLRDQATGRDAPSNA